MFAVGIQSASRYSPVDHREEKADRNDSEQVRLWHLFLGECMVVCYWISMLRIRANSFIEPFVRL